ncbi:hypothetical protein AYO40_06295 [Planctomycetaceae bacterium SCGC AG-212-D15]|nr:hypothetical protein AYO40_06295 [Planctomycetaceae bacterium SCGC AG-212-D15]
MSEGPPRIGPAPPPATVVPPSRVLVVDDQAASRYIVSKLVQEAGVSIEAAEDGRRALDRLRAEPFDLVLLDLQMPEMDGHAVLKAVRTDPSLRHLPVIVISGSETEAVRCIEEGADEFLLKPPNPVLLRARVRASLERKRLRDQELDYLAAVDIVAAASASIEAGRFDIEGLADVARRPDNLGRLARVFQRLVDQVYHREQLLSAKLREDAAVHHLEDLHARLELDTEDGETNLRGVDLKSCVVTDDCLYRLKAGLGRVRRLNLSMTEVTDAGLEQLSQLADLESLVLSFLKVTDLGLRHLQALTNLKHLDLSVTTIRGAGLEHLKLLSQLTSLDLSATWLDDDGLAFLAAMPQLEKLDLHMTAVGDPGLVHLAGLHGLRHLDIFSTRTSDQGLKSLAGLTHLRTLNLEGTSVSDAGLENLRRLQKLSKLQLNGLPISDGGLQVLSSLANLSHLSLAHTQITDAGLAHLRPLRFLASLDLADTAVSSNGVAELQKELPRTKIFHHLPV